ncbi:hypothetical protein M422DRAFT_264134 [Sphaerobolus stellatus SS14]|uniref:Uncharacterized protein n=1 Tax=Sphaerobolus stellatus (strain SS14) TaxID=990650 RepID=A0A0C9UJX1_SPHS4|nr:hypothetical protein M422DRAFT_273480 [Sphaerobolus stellatus SS14]KIJ33843.1 hypothetical protein M422DRAFT_264134 [Sphaerobolus stellatus SS14]
MHDCISQPSPRLPSSPKIQKNNNRRTWSEITDQKAMSEDGGGHGELEDGYNVERTIDQTSRIPFLEPSRFKLPLDPMHPEELPFLQSTVQLDFGVH